MSTKDNRKIPADFRYRDVYIKGKPRHDGYDSFRVRHPVMDRGRRAKIFAPFDALRGFGDAVAAKDILYEERRILSQEDAQELGRRLAVLHRLTASSRLAKANRVEVTITYYDPCKDENHEYYGLRGRYQTVTGICRRVDAWENGEEDGRLTGTIQITSPRMQGKPGPSQTGYGRAGNQAEMLAQRQHFAMKIPLEDVVGIESQAEVFCSDKDRIQD